MNLLIPKDRNQLFNKLQGRFLLKGIQTKLVNAASRNAIQNDKCLTFLVK